MAKIHFPYNEHHLYWNKNWYKTQRQKELRTHRLARVALEIPVHQNLHAKIKGISAPTHELLIGAIGELNTMEEIGVETVLESAERLANYFGVIAGDESNQVRGEARMHEAHLNRQIPYIISGRAPDCH